MSAARTLRSVDDLIAAGLVPPDHGEALEPVATRYAVALTPDIAALIDRADPHDPIARQFVPDPAELAVAPGERSDPIGDDAHSPVDGLVHRYPDRVLLKIAHVCAVYCRFCFRREMVGPRGRPALTSAQLGAALDYIRCNPGIWEVILSGGDPLVLPAPRLGEVIAALAGVDHVKIIRVHTRVPVVAPDRVTSELVRALAAPGKITYVVLHANHPRELTPAARDACVRFVGAGIPMLSQSVLLKGVNDDVKTLAALMRGFVEAGVKPYYLHHGDLARGTAHFRTGLAEGQALMRALRAKLSGLCQPTYVLDIPGGAGKVPVGPTYLGRAGDGCCTVEDAAGRAHRYPARGDDETA